MIINERPIIGHLVDAVLQIADRDNIIIATTLDEVDNGIEQFGRSEGINIFRGDNENVASRFVDIVEHSDQSYFIRLNGDSPLLAPEIIVAGMEMLSKQPELDLVTTLSDLPFPSGMNVELVKKRTFLNCYKEFTEKEHFEHVTRFFYSQPDRFKIGRLQNTVSDSSDCKFSVDVKEDLMLITKLFELLEKPHYEYSLSVKCYFYAQVK